MKTASHFRRGYIFICFVIGLIIVTGCKPTEQNYRNAYEAAKAKRESANAELMTPTTGLFSEDGPQLKIVEGDSLFVSRDRLRIENKDTSIKFSKYNIGVGLFKMHTNAEAAAEQLKSAGYPASAVRTTGDRWYTLAGCFDTLKEAREFISAFDKRNPDYPYIGLPGHPVLITY